MVLSGDAESNEVALVTDTGAFEPEGDVAVGNPDLEGRAFATLAGHSWPSAWGLTGPPAARHSIRNPGSAAGSAVLLALHLSPSCRERLLRQASLGKGKGCNDYSSYTVGFLKGKSAVRIHRELLRARRMTGLHFGPRGIGYRVSPVGRDQGAVRKYIRRRRAGTGSRASCSSKQEPYRRPTRAFPREAAPKGLTVEILAPAGHSGTRVAPLRGASQCHGLWPWSVTPEGHSSFTVSLAQNPEITRENGRPGTVPRGHSEEGRTPRS
jgi:hypothetical protein